MWMFKIRAVFFSILIYSSIYGQVGSDNIRSSLEGRLDSISHNDQKYRNQLDYIRQKYGGDSKEMSLLIRKINETDSLNLLRISSMIDQNGWPDANQGGRDASHIFFMVIQHADLKSQQKYLPLVREAVKSGKLKAGSLALLEDRVALKEGRKQIYGSQVSWNLKTNKYFVLPLEDPDHVDQRRAKVGLGSLADYIKDCCGLVWDGKP